MIFIRCSDGMIVNLASVQAVCDEGGELRAWYGDGRMDYHILAEGDEVEMKGLNDALWRSLCAGKHFIDMSQLRPRTDAQAEYMIQTGRL